MEIAGLSVSEYIDHINKSGCGYVPSSTFRFRSLGGSADGVRESTVHATGRHSAGECMFLAFFVA